MGNGVEERIGQLEVLSPLFLNQLTDHEDRLRKVEISLAKVSVYIGIASVLGSMAGGVFMQLLK